MDNAISYILDLLQKCTAEQRRIIFDALRSEFRIHPLEDLLNIRAETILEAINKDEKGLTFRMLRGVIAEAAFKLEVVKKLGGWEDVTPSGDLPYDYLLDDGNGPIRVQIKLQRSERLVPKIKKASSNEYFVVETQKTRGGLDIQTGENTRPYRFGEFDILGVAMQPSTKDWSSFLYTVARWLTPVPSNPGYIKTLQLVSKVPNEDWTDDFETAVSWYRSNVDKELFF